jgi:hypothetical protein
MQTIVNPNAPRINTAHVKTDKSINAKNFKIEEISSN